MYFSGLMMMIPPSQSRHNYRGLHTLQRFRSGFNARRKILFNQHLNLDGDEFIFIIVPLKYMLTRVMIMIIMIIMMMLQTTQRRKKPAGRIEATPCLVLTRVGTPCSDLGGDFF